MAEIGLNDEMRDLVTSLLETTRAPAQAAAMVANDTDLAQRLRARLQEFKYKLEDGTHILDKDMFFQILNSFLQYLVEILSITNRMTDRGYEFLLTEIFELFIIILNGFTEINEKDADRLRQNVQNLLDTINPDQNDIILTPILYLAMTINRYNRLNLTHELVDYSKRANIDQLCAILMLLKSNHELLNILFNNLNGTIQFNVILRMLCTSRPVNGNVNRLQMQNLFKFEDAINLIKQIDRIDSQFMSNLLIETLIEANLDIEGEYLAYVIDELVKWQPVSSMWIIEFIQNNYNSTPLIESIINILYTYIDDCQIACMYWHNDVQQQEPITTIQTSEECKH